MSDGRDHYVYRISDYTRTKEEHYYGSHTPSKGKKYNNLIDEFWTYGTSSEYNALNENKKENYKLKIIKVFSNPADKILYEAFLHQYHNVKIHYNFWNKSNQTPFGFDTTGITYKRTPEWILSKGKLTKEKEKATKSNPLWIATSLKMQIEKRTKTYENKGRKFFVFNYKDEILHKNIWQRELRKISVKLEKTSKEKPLGFSYRSKQQLNRKNNLQLIGCYAVEIIN